MSKKQTAPKSHFRKKAMLLYLGARMMNSFYTPDDPEYDAETEVIMDEVKKEAEQLGYKEMLFKDGKNLYRSGDFERPTLEYMERYKEESMYEELAERLTLRDFEQKFGRMLDFRNNEKDVNQFYTIREMRDSEFENFGVDRLNV